jgi:hypothetical protein
MPENIPDSMKLQERLRHPCFRQPEDGAAKVWRYMDLPKFIWLLKHNQLYMSRLDMLGDPYEGSLTSKTIEGINLFLRQHGSKDNWERMSTLYRQNQATTYVCCWHMNKKESEAMWRLYCGKAHGVAIRSTYAHLVSAIADKPEMYVGCVKYIDYEVDWFPDANAFHPVMHKRVAFAHEQEVRLVTSPSHFRDPHAKPAPHLLLPWDTDAWVEGIFVDPYAPEFFFEAVKTVVDAFASNLKSRLEWSQMKAAPAF